MMTFNGYNRAQMNVLANLARNAFSAMPLIHQVSLICH